MVESVRVTIKGWKDTRVYYKKVERRTPIEGEKLTKRMAERIAQIARMKVAPLKSGSGGLKTSIMVEKTPLGYRVSAGKGLPRPYAYYQEYGFSPHYIHKKQFGSKAKGKFMMVRQFFPFMGPAWRKVTTNLTGELRSTANRIVRK